MQAPQQAAASKQVTADGVSSKRVRDKLAELETEIEKFRQENASLERLRREREQVSSKTAEGRDILLSTCILIDRKGWNKEE